MTVPVAPEPLVTIDELARHIGVATKTIRRWRAYGLPFYGGAGTTLRFRVSEVEAWMRRNAVEGPPSGEVDGGGATANGSDTEPEAA
jgi:excisionase family DNA binding protein